jgi:Amt family ammonium transporter
VLILWLGWFGFNPGSTLGATDGRFPRSCRHPARGLAGVLGALSPRWRRVDDIGMAGNGAIAALVAITRPRLRASVDARSSGSSRLIVPLRSTRSTRRSTTPVGRAVGARHRRYLGAVSVRPLHRDACAKFKGFGDRGLFLQPARTPAWQSRRSAWWTVFAFVFRALLRDRLGDQEDPTACASPAEEEEPGLDISEHGMYGYPELFIPAPESLGYASPRRVA